MKIKTLRIIARAMLTLFVLSMAFLFFGCSTRKVERTKEKVHLIEKGQIERKAPADRVYVEFPRTPSERPKSTTVISKGKKGAKLRTTFDEDGLVVSSDCDCPEVSEKEKYDREMNYKINEKKSERAFNALAMKEARTTILWVTAIIALAWVARGFFKR